MTEPTQNSGHNQSIAESFAAGAQQAGLAPAGGSSWSPPAASQLVGQQAGQQVGQQAGQSANPPIVQQPLFPQPQQSQQSQQLAQPPAFDPFLASGNQPPAPHSPPPPPPVLAAEQQQQPPQQPTFLDQVRELGFTDITDEDVARDRLIQAYQAQHSDFETLRREHEQQQQLAGLGRELLLMRSNGADPSGNRPAAPASPAATKARESWWNPPQVDLTRVNQYLFTDHETGEPKWKPDTPIALKEGYDQYRGYVENWTHQLVNKPHEMLPKIMMQEIVEGIRSGNTELLGALDEYFDGRITQRSAEQEDQQFFDSIRKEHQSWMFEKDPVTGGVRRDLTNQPIPTRDGQRIMSYLDHAEKIGVIAARDQWQYAMDQFRVAQIQNGNGGGLPFQNGHQQSPAQQNVQQLAAQNRIEFLQSAANGSANGGTAPGTGVGHVPQMNGSAAVPNGQMPQNTKQTAGHQFAALLHQQGLI